MGQVNGPEASKTNNQSGHEAEPLLILIDTLFGQLSQPITVAAGLSHLMLSEIDENSAMAGDLKMILKQLERMKETCSGVKYITQSISSPENQACGGWIAPKRLILANSSSIKKGSGGCGRNFNNSCT